MSEEDGVSRITILASEMTFKADKWLPEEPDFWDWKKDEQELYIDKYVDRYFDIHLNIEKEGKWVSENRKKIVSRIRKNLTNE